MKSGTTDLLLGSALICGAAARAQESFTPLGTEFVNAISGDGLVVVGGTVGGAFRWTRDGGMVLLGTLPGGTTAEASAVNQNGSIIVGGATLANQTTRAFRW